MAGPCMAVPFRVSGFEIHLSPRLSQDKGLKFKATLDRGLAKSKTILGLYFTDKYGPCPMFKQISEKEKNHSMSAARHSVSVLSRPSVGEAEIWGKQACLDSKLLGMVVDRQLLSFDTYGGIYCHT